MPLYPLRISSTVEWIEKLNTSDCRELASKTRSNVKAPELSLDYVHLSVQLPYPKRSESGHTHLYCRCPRTRSSRWTLLHLRFLSCLVAGTLRRLSARAQISTLQGMWRNEQTFDGVVTASGGGVPGYPVINRQGKPIDDTYAISRSCGYSASKGYPINVVDNAYKCRILGL